MTLVSFHNREIYTLLLFIVHKTCNARTLHYIISEFYCRPARCCTILMSAPWSLFLLGYDVLTSHGSFFPPNPPPPPPPLTPCILLPLYLSRVYERTSLNSAQNFSISSSPLLLLTTITCSQCSPAWPLEERSTQREMASLSLHHLSSLLIFSPPSSHFLPLSGALLVRERERRIRGRDFGLGEDCGGGAKIYDGYMCMSTQR